MEKVINVVSLFIKWIEQLLCRQSTGPNTNHGLTLSGNTQKELEPVKSESRAVNSKYGKLRNYIIRNEGTRLRLYKCTAGFLTIGVGRNIETNGIRQSECDLMLDNDINECILQLRSRFDWVDGLDSARFIAIVDMAFNLGIVRFMGFKRMIAALSQGDHARAATEILDSKYAKDVPHRARRNAYLILRNEFADK